MTMDKKISARLIWLYLVLALQAFEEVMANRISSKD